MARPPDSARDLDPPRRTSFASRDEEDITNLFRELYADNHTRFEPAEGTAARLQASTADVLDLGGDDLSSSVGFSMQVDGTTEFLSYLVEGGGVRLRRGREDLRLGVGDCTVYPMQVPQHFEVSAMGSKALRLPMARIAGVAAELSDEPAHRFRVTGTVPVSAAMATYWRAHVRFVVGALLAQDSPVAHPMIREETVRATALAALHVFPNSALDAEHESGPGALESAALRRAVGHIEAQAGEAVTLADITAAARTSPRALQYAFRRAFDTTPMGYLRQVRLERAHQDLQAGDPTRGDTVAAIALRWGFAKPSRFAATYAAVYGHPPSHTLRS